MCVAEFGHHQLQQRSEGWRRWMLSGRSHVASAGICYPPPMYHPHSPKNLPPPPPKPGLSLPNQTRPLPGSAGGRQPCGGLPRGTVRGSDLRGAHPSPPPPMGADPSRSQRPVQRQRGQDGSLRWRLQHLLTVEGIAQSRLLKSAVKANASIKPKQSGKNSSREKLFQKLAVKFPQWHKIFHLNNKI